MSPELSRIANFDMHAPFSNSFASVLCMKLGFILASGVTTFAVKSIVSDQPS